MNKAPDLSEHAAFISLAPPDVAGWAAAFERRDIPVLATTIQALNGLRANEDAVDAHSLADTLAADPLMTLKLLRHVAALRRDRERSDPETATEALVMLGITPFFRDFAQLNAVEQRLAGQGAAQAGLNRVLRRAHRAARFALGFAVHRQDPDAALIHEAALLHGFAEMLLWLNAPSLALAVLKRQREQPGLRSRAAQRELLHIELGELQQALMKSWRLPELLVRISDGRESQLTQVRNVQLAIQLARHSEQGWDNPALPDDVTAIAELLNLAPEPTLHLLHSLSL